MREYNIENGRVVNINRLRSSSMTEDSYSFCHENLPIACHDVFIEYQRGILLVIRKNRPYKKDLWPLGGRIQRGVLIEESLRERVKKECGLELKDMTCLGGARLFAQSNPFNHDKGSDTPAFVYFARGHGDLKLDDLHKDPKIIKPSEYSKLRNNLHPYVKDFMDLAILLVHQGHA
jgi:ADP-ribose pyrophosphatase YjhB (NUDIX family)